MMLTVSDLKQYAYCPRVVYFHYVLPVESKTTYKMEHGRISEERMAALEKRRKFKRYGFDQGVRHYGKHLVSERMGLSGKPDLIIESAGRQYPVDFKTTEGGVRDNHRIQLTGYALIMEDLYGTPVERGFIFLTLANDIVAVEISRQLRERCTEAVADIRRMIEREWTPDPTPHQNRCDDCEYRNYCRDNW